MADQLMIESTLAPESAAAFSLSWNLQAPIPTGPSRIQNRITKHKACALVRPHGRTKVYATVLGTDRQNVMCFNG